MLQNLEDHPDSAPRRWRDEAKGPGKRSQRQRFGKFFFNGGEFALKTEEKEKAASILRNLTFWVH